MERYRPIIDDWEAFREACNRPQEVTVRRNPLKAGEDFEKRLGKRFQMEQVDWNPGLYRLDTEKPGKSLLHWRGEYYVQEESAAIPVEVLSPEEGDRVLDMAAAPGGKTTQIAAKIGNQGSIIANDASSRRLQSLQTNVYRMGAASVTTTNYDGRRIPGSETYDRVLLDAPCSGEGDRARRSFEAAGDESRDLAELQKKLLENAWRLLAPGGTLVYSTCTFAPEENEEVVLHGIENGMNLVEADAGAEHQRGATGFQGRDYGEEMKKTLRVYPHHLDSGGMFVAEFRK